MQYRNRHSIRKPSFDYRSSGAYFVTICTQERNSYFLLPELRKILEEQELEKDSISQAEVCE